MDAGARLRDAVDERRAELVTLTQDLIRIPTVNPPGADYRACCDYLADRLRPRGFDIRFERGTGAPGDSDDYPRWNVIARRDGRGPGPCVHFNSHIDVVEPGAGWTVDPFGGSEMDDRIYGRGSCDMKGGLAASIIATEAFLAVCPTFDGAVEISGTADEETGGYGGVAHLADLGLLAAPRVDHVIIPEPLNKDRICLGHRGLWWAEVETFGRIAHGSMPFLGDSAIRHMAAVLGALENELYPALAARQTAMPVVPEGARYASLNINSLHGGLGEDFDGFPAALVADSCRMVIDRRFGIEETMDGVKQELQDLLDGIATARHGFRYEMRDLFEMNPTLTDRAAPVVRAVEGAIGEVLGKFPDYVISPGTYDQKHIDRIGRLKDCIAYGPGILDLAHQPDEYVGIDDMLDSAKVMALALHRLLTGESGER